MRVCRAPAAVPSGSAGSRDAVGARTDTQHSTPSDARVGTKGEGEEGTRDENEMALLLPGLPGSAALPVPYGPLGEGVWELWQGDGYIKKKLQKKRKTEEKRNRGSELK